MPPRTIATVTLALGPLLIGMLACTPLQWVHPVTGTERAQADLADCDHLAFTQAWRFGEGDPLLNVPHFHRLPNGQAVYDPIPRAAVEPYANTGELRNFCMRAKGYDLVPVTPAPAP